MLSEHEECLASIKRACAERDEARALVYDLFDQACQVSYEPLRYDHACISAYEDAQAALIAWGLVKREECVRD